MMGKQKYDDCFVTKKSNNDDFSPKERNRRNVSNFRIHKIFIIRSRFQTSRAEAWRFLETKDTLPEKDNVYLAT